MLGVQPLAVLSHLYLKIWMKWNNLLQINSCDLTNLRYLKIWDFISAGRVKWNLQSPLHALKHGLRIMVVIIVWLWPGLGSKGGLQDGMSLIVILIHGEGVLLLTHHRRLRASGCCIVAGAPFHHLKWVWMNFKHVDEWSQQDVSGSLLNEFMCDNWFCDFSIWHSNLKIHKERQN